MKRFSSPTQQIGELGEHIAVQFLINKGFSILERNFTRKWGEIDIIAKKFDVIRFIEVKSVSCENNSGQLDVTPEDQMSGTKQEKLLRTVETYIESHRNEIEEWQVDLMCVYIDRASRRARVKVLEDLILG